MDGTDLYELIERDLDGNRVELINLLVDDLKDIERATDYSNPMEASNSLGLEREVKEIIEKLENIF